MSEQPNINSDGTITIKTSSWNRVVRERDEAIADRDIARLAAMDSDNAHDRMVGELEKVYKERDEATKECKILIEKLDGIKRLCDKIEEKADWFRVKAGQHLDERDEAQKKLNQLIEAATAVVDRWELPSWKDAEPTGAVIYRLRDALGREAE